MGLSRTLLLSLGYAQFFVVLAHGALDICASLSCLFKNGSLCDRTIQDCPRCLVHDPLLRHPICSKLQGDTSCQSEWTLCPMTPLDGEGSAAVDYTWVPMDCSDVSSSSGSSDTWTLANDTSPPLMPVIKSPPATSPAIANVAPASSQGTTTKASSTRSRLPMWLFVSLAVVGVLVLGVALVLLVRQRMRRRRHQLAETSVTPTPPPTDDEPDKSGRTGVSYGIAHEIESLRTLASRGGRVSSIDSVENHSSRETVAMPRSRPMPLVRLLFPTRTLPSTTTPIPEVGESPPTTPGSPSERSDTPGSQPTAPQPAYPLSLELSRFATYASRANGSPSADVPEIFLTDRSVTSQFTSLDYIDTHAPRESETKQAMSTPDEDTYYPDTSLTSERPARGRLSLMSTRTREAAAFKADVVDEWASTRTATFDPRLERQKKSISKWKAKYFAAA